MQTFFSSTGITATSANHIANMAKEYYEDLQTKLNSLRFYTTEVELLTAGKKVTTSNGLSIDSPDFQSIESYLTQIADCKSLIAYLREAIRAKEVLTNNADSARPENFEFPKAPFAPKKKTVEDILDTWPLDKIARYYRLQTYASTYGELVHKSGALSNARQDLLKKISNPTSVDLNGSETIISTFTPTVDSKIVDQLFFDIQKSYRSYQAEFNGLQNEINQTIKSLNDAETERYTREYTKYQQDSDLAAETLLKYRADEKARIEKLKITIPSNLKSIYETINNLSKK